MTRNTNQESCRGVEVWHGIQTRGVAGEWRWRCDTEYKPGELQGSGGGGVTRNTNQWSGRGVEVEV